LKFGNGVFEIFDVGKFVGDLLGTGSHWVFPFKGLGFLILQRGDTRCTHM